MKRKYVKYQFVLTGEVKILYEDERPDIYELTMKYYGNEKMPFINSSLQIIFLEFGEEDV